MDWGKLVIFFVFCCTKVYAGPDFSLGGVLPKGIYHPLLKVGFISSFTDKYNSDGALQGIGRRYDMHLDAKMIQKMSPDSYNLLKSVLNAQAFPNQKPADSLDPGILHFSDESIINYIAPGIAYGVNSSWTMGVVFPLVNYASKVTVSNAGNNNSNEIFEQISKQNQELNPELAKAQSDLAKGPSYLFREQLKANGYKDIAPYNQQYLGDVKVVSRYKLLSAEKFNLYMMQDLNLPTGPQYDPDDLTALPIFHRFYLESGVMGSYYLTSRLGFGLGLRYKLNFSDQVTIRVPEVENQALIPADRKELLNRITGNEVIAILGTEYSLTDAIVVGGAFEYSIKNGDSYSGSRNYNYYLLDKNTDGYSATAKFKAAYSTVEDYKRGTTGVPYEISYGFSDIILGKNIERQLTHELSAKMFF